MRGGILGVEEEAYYYSYLDSPGQGTGVLSSPDSRSDSIGESKQSSGCEIIYWDSLPALSDIGISKSYNYINISYKKVQNKTTTIVVFTVSHIQY